MEAKQHQHHRHIKQQQQLVFSASIAELYWESTQAESLSQWTE